MSKIVYLDNNATTQVAPEVVEEMMPYFTQYYGNPSSMHDFGGKVGEKIKVAREQVKEFMGASLASEIVFTASGSESANMAIRGVLEANKTSKHIITTKIEHPCVLNLYKALEKEGYRVTYLSVDSDGSLDFQELENAVCDETVLVSVMYANNETGIIFPVEKLAQIVKNKNPKFYFGIF